MVYVVLFVCEYVGITTKFIIKIKVNQPRYRPDVAQRVGRGIALLFHDLGTRRG
jgi:hypothetical protein